VPPLAPAKVLRTDTVVPTRQRSSRASRAAVSTATAAGDGSRGAAELSEPRPAATTVEPLPVAAEAQQAGAIAEPQQPAVGVEPQPAASTTVATMVVVAAALPTSPVPTVAGGPGATMVEIPDDDNVPPLGRDQWASVPVSAPETSAGALVARGDIGASLGHPADGTEASSSRAGCSVCLAQGREDADAPPAHFVEAQAEQELWEELRDHDASLNRALNEALRIHSGPAWRVFQVSWVSWGFAVSSPALSSFVSFLTSALLALLVGGRTPSPGAIRRPRLP
jgi:hypothetical protein